MRSFETGAEHENISMNFMIQMVKYERRMQHTLNF
jgi:hypothetical protein